MLSVRDTLKNNIIMPSGRSLHCTPQSLAQCLGFKKYSINVCWDMWGRARQRNTVAGSYRIAGVTFLGADRGKRLRRKR